MIGEKLVTLRKKHGYSQQEIADMLSVTRQTISNWEVVIAAGEKKGKDLHILKKVVGKRCTLDCSDWDLVLVDEVVSDLSGIVEGKVLDVNEEWIKIYYERRKEGTVFKKEKVAKLVDLSLIAGLMLEVTEE